MNILLTGGGTGGHVIPNIALIPYLREYDANISYMGAKDSIEEHLISCENIPFYSVTCPKLRRGKILSNLSIPWRLIRGIREARAILKRENIHLVFAKGGYVSLPASYAARSLKIPVVCHESDSTLGVANRLISRFSKVTITSFEDTKAGKHSLYLGAPIRDKIFSGNRDTAIASLHAYNGKPILLIMGGSSGAKHINDFVRDNIDVLTRDYYVVHLTGKGNNHIKHNSYQGIEYTHHIEDYMCVADIVLSRSGANAIAELTALHKRCIFIPLENHSTRGDQLENARTLEHNNTAVLLHEKDLNISNLMSAITRARELDLSQLKYDRNINGKIAEVIMDTALQYQRKK